MFKRIFIKALFKNNQKGVTAVLVAAVLTTLIGFSALAIDIGYLFTKHNELQNIADSAALAACGYLGELYKDNNYATSNNPDIKDAAIAMATAEENKPSDLEPEDDFLMTSNEITIGQWDWENMTIKSEEAPVDFPDCVKVIARRDSSLNGPVSTFFAGILGVDLKTIELSATATAVLSGLSKICEGKLIAPIGISLKYIEERLDPNSCNEGSIRISYDIGTQSTDIDPCIGWHNFSDSLPTPEDIEKKCEDLITDPPITTPETKIGDKFYFIEGNLPELFVPINPEEEDDDDGRFKLLFDFYRTRDDDNNNNIWTTTIPVYEDDGVNCTNPTKLTSVMGFVKMQIKYDETEKEFTLNYICEIKCLKGCPAEFTRGGGGIPGNLRGWVPNLIQ